MPLSGPFQVPTLPPQFFDLQSVQVLKGPQGTLFGRNSTGGAVLFVPAPPTDDFGGYARLQTGNYSDLQFEGAVNTPVNDKILLRFSTFGWHRKGYTRVLGGATDAFGKVLDSQRVDNQDVFELRGTVLLKPVEGLTNSTILTYHTDKNRGASQIVAFKGPGGVQIPVTGPEASPRVMASAVDLHRPASHTWAVVNTTTLDVSDKLVIKNILGHIEGEGYAVGPGDSDGTALMVVDGIRPPRPLKNRQTTEEIQFQGHDIADLFDFTVGGLIDLTRQPGSADKINIYTLTFPAGSAFNQFDEQFRQSRFTSKSFFGSATVHIAEGVNITAGARRVYDSVSERTAEYLVSTPDLSVNPSAAFTTLKTKFKGWSYNANADFQIAQGSLLYGGFRHGYKRGGFNAKPPSPARALFGPEMVNDYYAGLKQDLGVLGINGHFKIEGFYDIYHGAQRSYLTIVGGTLATVIANAEESTYRSFDTDFVADVAPWLELSGNYTFVDAYYNKYTDQSVPGMTGDLSVNPPGLVSRHKVSATARFHKALADGSELALAPSFNYQSRFHYTDQSRRQPNSAALLFLGGMNLNSEEFGANYAPGYKTVDARVEWNRVHGSNIDLAFNASNIFNKVYRTGGGGLYLFGFEAVSFGPPRMVTVEARIRF